VKRELLDIFACPVCRGSLKLGGKPRTNGDEVLSGTLTCTGCGETYSISDGVPDLLPPKYRSIPASELPGAN